MGFKALPLFLTFEIEARIQLEHKRICKSETTFFMGT